MVTQRIVALMTQHRPSVLTHTHEKSDPVLPFLFSPTAVSGFSVRTAEDKNPLSFFQSFFPGLIFLQWHVTEEMAAAVIKLDYF